MNTRLLARCHPNQVLHFVVKWAYAKRSLLSNRPGELHPGPRRSRRETLVSSGSSQPAMPLGTALAALARSSRYAIAEHVLTSRVGPFAPRPLQPLQNYYEPIRQRGAHWYPTACGYFPLAAFPLYHPDTFPRPALKLRLRSCRLYAGCRSAGKQAPSDLIPKRGRNPGFDNI